MNYRQTYPRRHNRQPVGARSRFAFVKLLLLLGLLGMVGWMLFQKTVHNRLRDRIQAVLNQKTQGSLLSVQLGTTTFVEGQGIRLHDVRLRMKNSRPPKTSASPNTSIEIYEAFVHLPVSLTQLVSRDSHPTAIAVRRARLQLVQNENGDWNLPLLMQQLSVFDKPGRAAIPIAFSDCTIELIESENNTNPLQLTDVAMELIPIQHEGRALLQLRGQFNGRETSGASFTVFIDQAQRQWQAKISVQQYRLNDNLLTLIPSQLRERFSSLSKMTGSLGVEVSATGDLDFNHPPSFEASGRLTDFSCNDHSLPLPFRQTSLDFSVDNRGLEISHAAGKWGQGSFELNYRQTGLVQLENWAVTGSLQDFDFEHCRKFDRWMPETGRNLCEDFSPAGTANVQFAFSDDGANLSREVHGQLTDMSFSYVRFPYRVDHCVGTVDWIDDDCRIGVQSQHGQQVMELKGVVKNPGSRATYQMDIRVPGELPIDDKMLTAIKAHPKLAEIISNFNPIGRVGGVGRIEKNIPHGPVSKSFDVQLKQCIVKHNSFDYPIHNVSGLVQVRNENYSFVELTGNNSSAQIVCNGNWDPPTGLELRFLCKSIPLDNQLRFALRPELREIWQGFRPRGTLDLLRVDLTLPNGQSQCDLVVDATMSKTRTGAESNSISINPVWFPFEIKRLTGNVKIGNGKIVLTDMNGRHGRSWLVCTGDGHYADDSWSVKLKNLLVGSLKVDDDLLAAVPKSLVSPIRQLSFAGLLNVQGDVTLAGQHSLEKDATETANTRGIGTKSTTNSLAWDLRFDMNQAEMVVGLPLKNVFGNVNLSGQYDGINAECRGELAIDSLTVYDVQITNLRGPIWLDNGRTAAGIFARPLSDPNDLNISPTSSSANEPQSVSGTMHGGVVKFDAQMNTDSAGEFYLQTTLADADLKQCARELAPQLTEISGRSFAALRLAGNSAGTQSYRGDGTVQLREAKIYELPVMLSLLKILKIREATRTAFDSSNVNFTVSGEEIELNRIEMLGDAISLLGNGTIKLDREIDLNFYSVMGRNRINIPLITDMYRASSQQVLWINVDGTLDNPQTHRHVLPQINDSLKQLFQPPEQHRMVRLWDANTDLTNSSSNLKR